MAQLVKLKQDTLTLEYPTLRDLFNHAKDNTRVDLGYYKLTGKIPGLKLCPIPGTLSMQHRSWVIEAENLAFANGSIVLDGHTSLIITGKNVLFKNVCISGLGRQGFQRPDPFLIHVSEGASARFDNCILECDGSEPHTLLVTGGSTCTITGTRIFGTAKGCALKVCSSTVTVSKRSLLQGGVVVTSKHGGKVLGQPVDAFAQPAPNLVQSTPAAVKLADSNVSHQALKRDTETEAQGSELPGGATVTEVSAAGDTLQSTTAASAGTEILDLAPPSYLEIRSSEVLAGLVSCLSAHGRSTVMCEGCLVRGSVNYGLVATHGAHLELMGCTVEGSSHSGVSITSGASLKAVDCTVSSGNMGIRVKLESTAALKHCTVKSGNTPDGVPHPLPPAPKPGMLPSFNYGAPAAVEVRGKGSSLFAEDCILGAPGVQGWRQLEGADVCVQHGLVEAMKPLNSLTSC